MNVTQLTKYMRKRPLSGRRSAAALANVLPETKIRTFDSKITPTGPRRLCLYPHYQNLQLINRQFSIFKIPERPPEEIPETPHDEYRKILQSIVTDDKFQQRRRIQQESLDRIIRYLESEESMVETKLPALQEAIDNQGAALSSEFRKQFQEQRERFLEESGFDEREYQIIEGAITQMTNFCARDGNGRVADILWSKILEIGFRYGKGLDTLMYVASTFHTQKRRKGKYAHLVRSAVLDILVDDNVDETDDASLAEKIAIMHDMLHKPTDRSLSMRVKLMIESGLGAEAETLLNSYAGDVTLRLRTYMPLLRLYLELDDLTAAMRVYDKMKNLEGVHLDAEAYITIISELAKSRRFSPTASIPKEVTTYGISVSSGPELLNYILNDMSSEILSISLPLMKRMYNAFAEGYPEEGLDQTNSLVPLQVQTETTSKKGLLVSRVLIDPEKGVCPLTGVKLRLLQLTGDQKKTLKEKLASIAIASQKSLRGGRTVSSEQVLKKFDAWLNTRDGRPFTAIVDGPNVGYFLQNFEGGRFSFHQIQLVVEALEKMGENPLVVLPRLYMYDEFWNTIDGYSSGKKQRLSESEFSVRDSLHSTGKLCVVPAGTLDDFFLIFASVADQRRSSGGNDISVATGNRDGRWPGLRPVIVSNDQFRDHRLELLEPFLFRRWFSNCMVNYHFSPVVDGGSSKNSVSFSPADFFSKEIQSNNVDGRSIWHLPLEEAENEWVCLKLP